MFLRIKFGISFVILYSLFSISTAQDTVGSLAQRLDTVERKVTNLVRKNQHLARELDQVEQVLNKLNEAKGVLSDYPACPGAPGFHLISDLQACYKLYPSSVLVNSTDSEQLCQSDSTRAHLVAIETKNEQDFLQAIWDNERGVSTISRYWTGASYVNSRWRWQTSREPIKYENWIATTSHNDDRFACMAVYSNEAYHWIDVACWSSHAVMCEIPHSSSNRRAPRPRN